MKNENIFTHALNMVLKNKRSYILLSVTIVMSFTFFLSYLVYMDSNVMTENAEDIYSEPYLIDIDVTNKENAIPLLLDKLKTMDDTHYYMYNSAVETQNFSGLGHGIYVFPKEVWAIYSDLYNRIERTDGKKIKLEKNEILISEERYTAIKKKKDEKELVKYVPIQLNNGNSKYLKLKVVGTYKSSLSATFGRGNWDVIIMSNETLESLNYVKSNIHIMVYTKTPELVLEETNNMDVITYSTYNNKEESFKEIRVIAKNKAFMAIILFALLGINLYSSFKNALNDRKFEIGVKRAIGASGSKIIRQFLYEGIIVVVVNIILSTLVTICIFTMYKYYMEHFKNLQYIIYLSKHSLIMFAIVSIFLTVVFSLMFALESARVEVIKYLKAE